MNFFTFTLLQPDSFDWAKDFLQSKAWDFFKASSSSNSSSFHLPKSCPSVNIPICINSESTSVVIEELPFQDDVDTSFTVDVSSSSTQSKQTPKTKKGKHPILSETDVRRSLRIKKLHKGFKASGCKDKNCLGCSSSLPAISNSIISDIGAAFCDINPEDLSDAKLNAKPSNSKAVGKKAAKKKSSNPPKNGGKEKDQ
jgi:hypothetical protein